MLNRNVWCRITCSLHAMFYVKSISGMSERSSQKITFKWIFNFNSTLTNWDEWLGFFLINGSFSLYALFCLCIIFIISPFGRSIRYSKQMLINILCFSLVILRKWREFIFVLTKYSVDISLLEYILYSMEPCHVSYELQMNSVSENWSINENVRVRADSFAERYWVLWLSANGLFCFGFCENWSAPKHAYLCLNWKKTIGRGG